eukprot:2928-Eustigmatos_ZCMA.PRE.1
MHKAALGHGHHIQAPHSSINRLLYGPRQGDTAVTICPRAPQAKPSRHTFRVRTSFCPPNF